MNIFTGVIESIGRLSLEQSKAKTVVKTEPEAHCCKDNTIAGKDNK